MFRFIVWIALALILAFTPLAAFAQTEGRVLSSEMQWLAPYAVDLLIYIFGPLITGALLAVAARAYALLGLKQTAEHRATAEQVLDRALDLARKRYGKGLVIPFDMEHSAVRLAAEYAVDKGPKAFKRFGITNPDDPRLREMIEARLGDLMDPQARASGAIRSRAI